jgi:hypothetical protein
MNSSDSVCRISASWRDAEECFPTAASFDLDVGIVRAQSQRLHVGTNDIANPADFGVTVDFVDVTQCPKCKQWSLHSDWYAE